MWAIKKPQNFLGSSNGGAALAIHLHFLTSELHQFSSLAYSHQ
jgi:hypothetical protein